MGIDRKAPRLRVLVAGALGVAAVVVGTAVAAAGATQVVGGLAAPWGLTVAPNGSLLVAEAGTGSIVEVTSSGQKTVLGTGLGEFVGDVAVAGRPNQGAPVTAWGTGFLADGSLHRLLPNGKGNEVANLVAFEEANNPDAGNTYGPVLGTQQPGCDVPEELVFTGVVESNPYGLTGLGDGSFLVADAAGNDVLRVRPGGRVAVAAVLPPYEKELTAEAIAEYNAAVEAGDAPPPTIPACAEGMSWAANPVPTSAAIGPDGALYVSGLTGFPETPFTGVVFRVDPTTGVAAVWHEGLTFAVDLAFAPDGAVVVAELFGFDADSTGPGLVSRVETSTVGGRLVAGATTTLARAVTNGFMMPLGVTVSRGGSVYATGGPLFGGDPQNPEPGGVWRVG